MPPHLINELSVEFISCWFHLHPYDEISTIKNEIDDLLTFCAFAP